MTATDLAVARMKTEEGFRATAYRDTAGHLTIGYGFNVDAGISQYAALELLTAQAAEVTEMLAGFWWAKGLDDIRLSVLVDLAFNLGPSGLLHFPKMLTAIGTKDWQAAHDELLNSDAARQLPARYQALAVILYTGETK